MAKVGYEVTFWVVKYGCGCLNISIPPLLHFVVLVLILARVVGGKLNKEVRY